MAKRVNRHWVIPPIFFENFSDKIRTELKGRLDWKSRNFLIVFQYLSHKIERQIFKNIMRGISRFTQQFSSLSERLTMTLRNQVEHQKKFEYFSSKSHSSFTIFFLKKSQRNYCEKSKQILGYTTDIFRKFLWQN